MTAISNEKKRIRIKSHWAADKATSKIPKKSRVAADILSRHAWMNTLLTCHGWVNCIVGYSEWQAKHVCLFKLLKEEMWTSFLILWLYMCSTHLIVMHCVWQSSTYWLTDTCICSFLQNHFVSLPFALKSITRDWRQSRWVLFFVSNFLSCASSACEIRERFWLLCSVTNRWIA